jgi:hypothetical protein
MNTNGPTVTDLLRSIVLNGAALLRLAESGLDFTNHEDYELLLEADNTLTDILDEAEEAAK